MGRYAYLSALDELLASRRAGRRRDVALRCHKPLA